MEVLNVIAPLILLPLVVALVMWRLPKVKEVNHSREFKLRRVMNWLPLGLMYAFFYMARYNLKVSKFAFEEMTDVAGNALMSNADFSSIFFWGTLTYGISFLINGPLTDHYGGKKAILVGGGGTAVMTALMGLASYSLLEGVGPSDFLRANFVGVFSVLYAINMYFQSFGAVAVVKVNAPWFHIRERGTFGAIFGILISLGVFLAFDGGYLIVEKLPVYWVFGIPFVVLAILWVVILLMVEDTPGQAGFEDFHLGDASEDGPRLPVQKVFMKMMSNPIIITIALIEFCSGFLRQAIMQWYRTFAKQTDVILGLKEGFVYEHWGLLLCCAGIMGGVFAGTISDHIFKSRRGPVAAVLYGGMLIGAILLTLTYQSPLRLTLGDSFSLSIVGGLVVFMSMCVIGVHGMLSGTASMDFGGKRNVGVAVGIIDGFVYLGTAVMAITYGWALPEEQFDPTGALTGPVTDPANWLPWPAIMIPVALVGFLLATRVWNAKPKSGSAEPPVVPVEEPVAMLPGAPVSTPQPFEPPAT